MTILQTIPLNRLVQSKSNVRRTGRTKSIESLMASIEAIGLRQNLNVKPTSGNRFEVVAGGRRLEALKRLAKEGRLDSHSPVACLVLAEGENPAEISLTENAVREAMHPDDECTAFQDLITAGQSIEDVAARFGVTPAVVRQRLKLAGVSPVLRSLFRKGDLDLSQMMAFTLVDDHAEQEGVWKELPEWSRDADDIREALTRDGVRADHRLARFVGLAAYEAAGGAVLRDLFGDEHSAYLVSVDLLEQLAVRRLEEEAAHVQAEGWKWVRIALKPDYMTSYGRVYPQPIQGSDAEAFEAVDIARAGARITLDHGGELLVERGLVERKDELSNKGSSGNVTAHAVPTYPAVVIEDLTAHRTAALRLELAHNPAAALAATVHAMALPLLYDRAYRVESCLGVRVTSERLDGHMKDGNESSAHAAIAGEVAAWQETLPADPSGLWDWCLAQDRDRLMELLALLAGLSVNSVHTKTDNGSAPRLRHADALAAAVGLDMTKHWTPSPDGFFSRLSKGMMVHLLTEAGEDQQAIVLGKVKKTEAAHRTASALTGKGWLPEALKIGAIADDDADHADDGHDGDEVGDDDAAAGADHQHDDDDQDE